MKKYLPKEDVMIGVASTPKEKESVYRFRYQIYIEEMRYQLPGADHKNKLIYDEMDEWGFIFFATDKNKIIGTLRVNIGFPEDFIEELRSASLMEQFQSFPFSEGYSNQMSYSSKLMIEPNYRGSSLLYELWAAYYNICRTNGILFDFRACAPCLTPIQEGLGARRYRSNVTPEGYGCMVYYVILLDDIDYFEKINSPLFHLAKQYKNTSQAASWLEEKFSANKYLNNRLIDVWSVLTAKFGNPFPQHTFSLFKGLSEEEAKICVGHCHLVYFEPNDEIVYPINISREIFTIASGEVSVKIRGRNNLELVYRLTNGQTFGSRAFLENNRYLITVTAVTDTHLLILPRSKFEKMQTKYPKIAQKLWQNLQSINY